MRFLNKIIFINSAHVPYAEIKLDGNVHFIGTQGVGKSTLLRAILFFYNVDKSKLGIRTQDKQLSYDEFYFPYPNSYIIYEVCRENGTFFVMTFKSNGRVAFRIVDCVYDRSFFLDEDNNVRYEWGRISEQIGTKIFRSNIIRGYEEIKDIIYGNLQNVSKELRRFNLMESSRYHNVPRTIQNIFLNQSLESRVIKDTIINSMDFADDSIDLNFYREHVKDFRQQYDDIWKWYKKEKNGKIKVKSDAENVIDKYALYEVTKNTIHELCAKLNFAFDRDTERLPLLEANLEKASQELARQKRLLSEEDTNFTKERDKYNCALAVIRDFLSQVTKKRQHFEEIKIDEIVAAIHKEKEFKIQRASLVQQEQVLTSKNRDIKSKYDVLRRDVEDSLEQFKLLSAQKINDIDRREMQELSALQSEFTIQRNELDEIFHHKMEEVQAKINEANEEKTELRLQENKISVFNPFKEEMDGVSAQLRELDARKFEVTSALNEKKQEITRITHEVLSGRKDLENDCEKKVNDINHDKAALLQRVEKVDELLNRQKGSFVEWLTTNAPDWESTIGKVVDDEMLYNTSLEPKKVGDSDSLYGVRLDLQNIDKKSHTPDEIRAEKADLENRIRALETKIKELNQQLEKEVEELERQPSIKLKALRMDQINLDAEVRQIPVRVAALSKKMKEHSEQLEEWRHRELKVIHDQLNQKTDELHHQEDMRREAVTQKEKDLEKAQRSFEKRKREIAAAAKQERDVVAADKKQHETIAQMRLHELEAQMNAELKGLGIDVDKLSEIRKALQDISEKLNFIDSHRSEYYLWIDAKSELFDKEAAKREERRRVDLKLEELTQRFNSRREKKENEIYKLNGEIADIRGEQTKLNEAIVRVNSFKLSSSCPMEVLAVGPKETSESLSVILDEIRDTIDLQQQRMEEFKKAVNVFKSNFSPQNTFHFRTEFNVETDYTEFASELNEFMSNQKIEEYRTRTSNQYAVIIKRIAREVGDLNKHNADIKLTINDINKDFRENNFAGVIKDIELRAVESNDRLMQQLLNIKKFDEEYGFDIGELNLFSNEQNQSKINRQAIDLLMNLIEMMDVERKRERITLSDTFKLEFKVKENDNDTNWVEKLSNVGSDGTDILVKSMVNIMLINVFKRKITKRFGDFKLHCMMDEIGKLHPDNVAGILKFANVRNIYLINSSPTTYNAQVYKYTYSLSKDERSNTQVKTLLTIK